MKKTDTTSGAVLYPAAFAWLGLGAVYLGFMTVGFVFHFLPPILPVVIADLGISHGQAGLLMSLFALPGILLSLPGGWLVDRYGERLVGSVGVTLMGVGTLLLGLASEFSLILLARVLSGVGAMVGVVALQRLVIRLFTGRRLGLPIGISGSAVPVGIVIVLNTAGPLAESDGWRIVARGVGGATAIVGVVFGVIIWFITRGQSLGRDQKQDDKPLTNPSRMFRPIWIAGVVWFCANGAMTAFMTFAPDHFQGLGFDVSARGLFTSIPMWTSAALGMFTGWFTDRNGGRALFMISGMSLMGVSLLLLPADVVSPSLIGLALGLSLAAVVTPTISLPGALLPASHTGRGYGMLATCANLGIFVVPPLAGLVRDRSGGYVWPFVIMGVVALGGVVAAEVLRRGRFMPGFSRHALVVMALLLVIGCGSQDRYEVVSLEEQAARYLTMGEFIDETMFMSDVNYGVNVADAWSATDFVVSGNYGQIIRVQDDLYTSLRLPAHERVMGVICQPDGSLLAGLWDGEVWEWSGGTWYQWPDDPTDNMGLLVADHLGRPLVRDRYKGILRRYQAGAWEQVGDFSHGYINKIWSHPDQGTWLTTESNNILQLTEAGVVWDAELTFHPNWSSVVLAGDGGDRLVASVGDGSLWLREAGVWVFHDGDRDQSTSGMVWHEGELYARGNGGDLVVWRNDTWQILAKEAFNQGVIAVVESVGNPLYFGRSGAAYAFDGHSVAQLSQGVGGLEGLAEYEGQLMAYVSDGSLFRAEDVAGGVWRFVDQTSQFAFGNEHNNLLKDDRGLLVAYAKAGLEVWGGHGFSVIAGTGGLRLVRQLPSGEILLATNNAIGSLQGGQVTWVEPASGSLQRPIGVRRHSRTAIDVLNSEGLYRLTDTGEYQAQWIATGWDLRGLVPLAENRSYVLGRYNAREIVNDKITDVTPIVESGDQSYPLTLLDVTALPSENILAWVGGSRGFLLRDESQWWIIKPAVGSSVWQNNNWEGGRFLQTEHNGLRIFGDNFIGRIELMAGTP